MSGGRPVLELETVDDTRALGEALGRVLRAGDLVVLAGPLGAGKTVLAQGIGAGMNVTGRIASPTFVIARFHPAQDAGAPALVHVDAYRLSSLAEVDDLDLDADAEDAVTVVEWGRGVAEQLAETHLLITLDRSRGTETRTAVLESHGAGWSERVAAAYESVR
jgi:tRNA threonylcarbamoyladenosine biosynthesis protein TsaE